MDLLLRILSFLGGFLLVGLTLTSAIRTFILPRGAPDPLVRNVFQANRFVFNLLARRMRSYASLDNLMAYYAPLGSLALLPVWLILVSLGFTAMYWALGDLTWFQAFRLSGSSLLTLGIATGEGFVITNLQFAEATFGLILVALLIAYLPTIYAAFSRRESAVNMLEVRAGNPPSAIEMLKRYHRIHGLDRLNEVWQTWEAWFADMEESHTTFAMLVFFRSPHPDHSWVTAAGAVLDTAALTLAAIEVPFDPQAALCLRAGYLAFRRIADYFNIPYVSEPRYPDQDISLSQQTFDQALSALASAGLPLKADHQQAWLDFAGWRVNYDSNLLAMANLVLVPPTPWISEHELPPFQASFWKKK